MEWSNMTIAGIGVPEEKEGVDRFGQLHNHSDEEVCIHILIL